jgi:two-component system chemotaxis response regulator CheY
MKELTVLLVEDSEPMMDVVVNILKRFGFEHIITATNGEEGFRQYQNHKPDLIITDWHMEPVDGVGMIQWIRRNKHSPNRMVPIILMTGYTEHSRITSARDTGTTEILVKPFEADDLARRIMHIIDKPRDFVETQAFFGPDRRRRKNDVDETKDRRVFNPEGQS